MRIHVLDSNSGSTLPVSFDKFFSANKLFPLPNFAPHRKEHMGWNKSFVDFGLIRADLVLEEEGSMYEVIILLKST